MRTSLARRCKTLVMLSAAAALFCLGQDVARADALTISGTAQGSFVCLFPPCAANNLTFAATPSFSIQAPNGGGGLVTLGTINLTQPLEALNGNQFSLTVIFNQPPGIGGGTGPFSLNVTGTFELAVDGSDPNNPNPPTELSLFFGSEQDQNPLLTFGTNGSFQFHVRLVTFENGTATLMGLVSNVNNPVPEPATVILLATGLAGVVGAARRRRRAPR